MRKRMKNEIYRIFSLVLVSLMMFSSVDLTAMAVEPENETAEKGEADDFIAIDESELLTYHLIPGEGDYASIKEHRDPSILSLDRGALRTSYTLEDSKEYLPPVRNQNPYGTCWAHSAMAMAEIGLIKNNAKYSRTDINLSELQLAYFMYHSPATDPLGLVAGDSNLIAGEKDFLQLGGNVELAATIMQGWICAGDDLGELAYSNAENVLANGLVDTYAFDDIFHLKNYYKINLKEDPEEAKQAILKYGAITGSYFHSEVYFNSDTNAFYCSEDDKGTNHAISIIGWDDDFSKDNFISSPEGDGAWLIRNSWNYGGDTFDMGYRTYFWMSYYDKSLTGSLAMEFEEANKYDHNYHYDGGAVSTYDYIYSGGKAANVFTAKGSTDTEMLQAVSFEMKDTNVNYKIEIYKNLDSLTDPESGTLCTSQEGTTSLSGYYTIPLTEQVSLQKGETFSVVITVSHSDIDYVWISKERSVSWDWLTSTVSSQSGESFLKRSESSSWSDIGASGTGNYRIKAFTVDAGTPVLAEGITLEKEALSIPYENSQFLKATVTPNDATNKNVVWSTSDETVATVSKGVVTATGIGEATITASLEINPSVKAECKVTVIPKIRIKNPQYVSGYGDVDYQNIILGRTIIMDTEILPATDEEYTLKWESSNGDVLRLTGDGSVYAAGKGKANIIVSAKEDPEIKGSVTLDVKKLDYVIATEEPTEDNSGIIIKWEPVEGADYYIVKFGTDSSYENVTSHKTSDCTLTISNLEQDTTYYYTVMAYNSDASMSSPGWYSHNYTIKPLHTVTYVLNGGENDPMNPVLIREGLYYSLKDGTRKGYSFAGWYRDSEFNTRISTIGNTNTEDLTLYAKWNPIQYKVAFDGNGYTGGSMSDDLMIYDAEGTLKKCAFVKEGYHFLKWNTEADGSGASYGDQEAVMNLSDVQGDTFTLYAIWEKDEETDPALDGKTWSITYELNGGENAATNPASYTDSSSEITLAAPIRAGYEFVGWYQTEFFEEDTKISVINKELAKDLKLYAKWKSLKNEAEDWGDISESDREEQGFETPADVPEGIWTAGISDRDYTGKAITFENLHVYHHKTLLVEQQDYTVKYKDNTKAGTATVAISGKGNYYDNISRTFRIERLDISKAAAADIGLEYKPDKVQKGTTTVSYRLNGSYVTLKKGTDFDYFYPGTSPSDADYSEDAFCKEGEYTVEIRGKGNYFGTCTFKETISPERIPINKAAIAPFPNFYYAGFAIEVPKYLKLTYNRQSLNGISESEYRKLTDDEKSAYHYTYQFSDNIEVGTARIKITGVNSFMGAKNLTFKIVTRSMKGLAVEGVDAAYFYTGKDIEPAGSANDDEVPSGFRLYVKGTSKAPEKTLVKGQDYTVNYIKNQKAGTATMVFTGINGYSGTWKKTFKIKAIDLNSSVNVAAIGTVPYEKDGAVPKVTVTDKRTGVVLKAGTDYTLKYSNNKVINSLTKTPTVIIAGKGNYSGKLSTTFAIAQSSLERTEMLAGDVVYKDKAGICNPVITVTDTNGKKLKAGMDYEIIRYEYVSDITVIVKETVNGQTVSKEKIREAGDEVGKDDIIPASNSSQTIEICAIIRGRGNYANESINSATFRYVAADISKAKVKVTPQSYTGKKIEPAKNDIEMITLGGKPLNKDDYDIIGYGSGNIAKGKGKMIICGKGNYGGVKTVEFKIDSKSFK